MISQRKASISAHGFNDLDFSLGPSIPLTAFMIQLTLLLILMMMMMMIDCFGSPLLVCGLKRDFNDDCPCERFLNHVFSESMYASMITMSE